MDNSSDNGWSVLSKSSSKYFSRLSLISKGLVLSKGIDKRGLKEFLNNPYENYDANNMQQFFLKTFGEGITKLYLQPYNEKIWKFDPSYMDTQMVERIPKPPKEDVIKSAEGIETEGYKHQLYFNYPKAGGIEQLILGFKNNIIEKADIVNPVNIKRINKTNNIWNVKTDRGDFTSEMLINCMPLNELFNYIEAPQDVVNTLNELKYNSIYIILLQARKDNIKDNFALYVADKSIIFHRISKLNFLGENYSDKNNYSTILAEITFRSDSYLSGLGTEKIKKIVLDDLDRLNLVSKKDRSEERRVGKECRSRWTPYH